jgi:catechol-2,3-dioxygenase
MKRMHLHFSVADLSQSIVFYNTLFGAAPTIQKLDYAKWMLDDPLVNFAISQRGAKVGLDHVGIQVENDEELVEIKARLDAADLQTLTQQEKTCCYAKSDKHWVQDPSGIAWETYRTLGIAPTFNNAQPNRNAQSPSACCAPTPQPVQMIIKRRKAND